MGTGRVSRLSPPVLGCDGIPATGNGGAVVLRLRRLCKWPLHGGTGQGPRRSEVRRARQDRSPGRERSLLQAASERDAQP